MNTQLLVTVKDTNIIYKFYSIIWPINIFMKAKIRVMIDDPNSKPIILKARKEPYEVPITPGEHVVYFVDKKAKSRGKIAGMTKAATFGLVGASMGLAMGSGSGAILGAGIMGGGRRAEVRDNVMACALEDGDELAVTVKPKFKKVKITIDG